MRDAASSVSRDQQTPPLSAITTPHELMTTLDGPAVIDAKAK